MNEKIRVLILSDSPTLPTGFARISRDLAEMLGDHEDFEVYYVGHNYLGPEVQNITLDDPNMQQIRVNYRLLPGDGGNPYAANVLEGYIKRFKPDILFVLLDTFMLMQPVQNHGFGWFLQKDLNPAKFVMYFPSDGERFPWKCEEVLKKSHYPIAMAKFGQAQVADLFGIKTDYIPHHFKKRHYYPVSEEERKQFKKRFGIPETAFVFGHVGRNQPRKMIGTAIDAFNKFMKKNPKANAYLLLHCDANDAAGYAPLPVIAHEGGFGNRVIFTGVRAHQGFKIEDMRSVYGAMDVQVSSTTGEGFGIPTIEGMACGVPIIITDYTTSKELTDNGGCGWLVPVAQEIYGTWNVKRGFVDVDKFAEAMQDAYNNPEKIREFGRKSVEKVFKEFEWELVKDKWIETLKKVVIQ